LIKTLGMIFRLAKIGRILVIEKPNPFARNPLADAP